MNKLIHLSVLILLCLFFMAGCGPSDAENAAVTDAVEPPTPIPPTPTPPPTLEPLPEGWSILEIKTFPPPRSEHAMVTLPDGRLLMFGGMDENGNVLNDTWIFGPTENAQGIFQGGETQLVSLAGLGWLSGGITKSLFKPMGKSAFGDFGAAEVITLGSMIELRGSCITQVPFGVLLYGGINDEGEFSNGLH